MKQGFIKLHRSILEWEWYDDPNTMRLFLHLLLNVNHKDNKWRGITIKKGQKLTSQIKLSEETGLTRQQVRTSLKKLTSTNEVTMLSNAQHTVITVNNWELYQDQPAKQPTGNQPVTNEQPTSNQRVTTNKNDKNVNNDKNEKKSNRAFSKPTNDEINKYAFDKKLNLEGFFDYYESNGWKVGKNAMKNWQAAGRNWNKNQGSFSNQQKKPEFNDDSTDWAVDAMNGKFNIMGLD